MIMLMYMVAGFIIFTVIHIVIAHLKSTGSVYETERQLQILFPQNLSTGRLLIYPDILTFLRFR
jgi:hypothetical protein